MCFRVPAGSVEEWFMRVHIGNLPKSLTEPELRELVVVYAQPGSLEIVKDGAGGSRGYAFAEFADAAQGAAVITGLDGKEVGGQTLKVAEARPRKGEAGPKPVTPLA
jgi:splicing factor U2AF subunit